MEENNYYQNPNEGIQGNGYYDNTQGYNNAQGYNNMRNPYEGKAKISQICGIIGVIPCFWGLIGLVLSIIALVMSNQYVKLTGDNENGAAKTGRICGLIGVIGSAITFVLTIAYFILVFSLIAGGILDFSVCPR